MAAAAAAPGAAAAAVTNNGSSNNGSVSNSGHAMVPQQQHPQLTKGKVSVTLVALDNAQSIMHSQ
jgi:hypothetical protein